MMSMMRSTSSYFSFVDSLEFTFGMWMMVFIFVSRSFARTLK